MAVSTVAQTAAPAGAALHSSPAPSEAISDEAVDAELLDIFLTEADEVLACVRETLPALRVAPDSQTPLTTLRRSFHTLKGSSRMVALNAFGEAAWSIEQVLNLRLAGESIEAGALLPLIEVATDALEAWVEDIRTTGRSTRTPDTLAAAAARVKAGEPFRFDAPGGDELVAAVAAFVSDAGTPEPNMLSETASTDAEATSADAAWRGDDFVALPAVEEIAIADTDFSLFRQDDSGTVLSGTTGEAGEAADAAETAEVADAAPSGDDMPDTASRPSGDVIDFPMAALSARPDESIKRIGDIEISMPLHGIYLAETDELVRMLANDFAEWRHEPARPVAITSVHAAHSLAGSSATVGFDVLQQVAHRLEAVLQQLAKRPVPLLTGELDTLELAVERMRDMLHSFALGEMPPPRHDVVAALSSLHDALALRADRDIVSLPADELANGEPASVAGDTGVASAPESDEASGQAGIPLDPASVVRDEIDQDLLPVFIEEGRDLLPQIGELLRVWRSRPADAAAPQALLRAMHTLKGSARMAGAMRLGQQIHEMEARIEQLMHAGSASSQAIEDLLARHDYGLHLFEQLQNPPAIGALPVAADAAGALPSSAGIVAAAGEPRLAGAGDQAAPLPVPAAPLVRVRADILDRLVNQAGEVSISRSRLETGVGALQQSLGELTENVGRLRSQLREIEIQAETQISSRMTQAGDRGFDPLEFDRFTRLQELTRMMAESVNDVASVQQNIARTAEGAVNDLLSQERLTRELQQDLMRVRMVQFGSIAERLYRVTRQTAKEVDKRVNLDIRGGGVELDRGVLERMTGPFEHLLRNAIAHGIETRAARREAGKQEAGELLIEVRQEGNEVVIRFTDDGGGLDMRRIRDKARAVGLLADDREIADAEASELIFHPGFSTAAEVTELAGRGIGMDVVRSEAAALGGRVAVHSEPGRGAQFTIHLPLTLAVTQVVLLSTGGKTYAVPSVLVEQVQQLKANPLASAYNDGAVLWQGHRVPLHYLSALLGDEAATPVAQQYSPVIVLRSGNDRLALHVDQVIGNREVVVKNIGPQLARMTGIAGATVLGSGDIVLILNPVPIAMRRVQQDLRAPRLLPADGMEDAGAVAENGGRLSASEPVHGLRTQPIVMVVDDSLTVRRVTQRLLSREGYQAVLAKDGVDALEQLQAITPDVILLDIEMPRMDGFDLTRNLRDDERTRAIPIVMITSRTAAKHRNYALELGVNEYLGKPYREEELVRLIAGFVGRAAPVA
ncbi:MAG: Hpt domain-containing protein [Burkholderiaceae bacterium]